MSGDYSEAMRLRIDDDGLGDDLSQVDPDEDGCGDVLVCQTTTHTTYPTSAGAFYYCKILAVLGAEVEGGAATLTDTGRRLYAYNLGASVPPSGTNVLVWGPAWRRTFSYP